MTRAALLLLAACAAAWWLRHLPHGDARAHAAPPAAPDDMAVVQPPDPWPPEVLANVEPAPDPPYLEAVALARMRAAYGGRPIGGT